MIHTCPKSVRILSILQLCLAFTLLSWYLGYPYMGQLFSTKSKMHLVQSITEQKERFAKLPTNQKLSIHRLLESLKKTSEQPFAKKALRSLHIITFEISPLEQMWLIFSILVPLLFLLHIEGARQAALILPLITLSYALDNHWNGYRSPSEEQHLFPSEQHIVQTYLNEPLGKSLSQQKEQLTRGWELYLIDQWAQEIPSENTLIRKQQIEKGTFAFQVKRALTLASHTSNSEQYAFKRAQSLITLGIFLLWNFAFALLTHRAFIKQGRADGTVHS